MVCADGARLGYDALALCTGTRARRLGVPGVDLRGALYLRTLADADRIKSAVLPGSKAVIIGGGYIGLEVAASLRKLGCTVVVIEALQRVMNRVVAAPVSAFFAAEHARHGVEIVTNAAVAALEGDGRVQRVVCADGRAFAADLAVIGIGAVPNDELARDAGLAVDNGVVVDAFGRTSDPAIFAAGDVTNHPNALFDRRMRLELVHNAMEQAKSVARTIAGQPQAYADVPWFWSDQYDLKLQIAGVGDPDDELILRGDPATRAFSCLHLRDRAPGRDRLRQPRRRLPRRQEADRRAAADRPCPGGRSRDQTRGPLRTAQASWSRMIRSNMPRATGAPSATMTRPRAITVWICQSSSKATRSASRPAAIRPLRASPVASATLAVTTRSASAGGSPSSTIRRRQVACRALSGM